MKTCHIFDIYDPNEAWNSMDNEIVKDYGDYCNGHYLYTWDDGGRKLMRCRKCGGYILMQKSEFHSFMDDDSYYTDFFPVSGDEEAQMLNEKYSGFALEGQFPGRYLMRSDGQCSWSRPFEGKDLISTYDFK
ncbi:MAG: hypothetical protein IKE27_04400 [Oscillospiraceae bacterium]|nr:hypothetical protein [Oscillospiraceae bacterium]